MTDLNPLFARWAVFVIDVQKHLIEGPDAVPDALEVRKAISDIIGSIRQHNDSSSRKTKIVFVQHDDKDPQDPLHKGKTTWELEFNPRKDDDAEMVVSKDVRKCLPLKEHWLFSQSTLIDRSSSALGNVFESNVQLAKQLRLQGISQITAMGIQSECCVRSSILGAIASGFDAQSITLLRGAHSTFNDASAGKFYSQIKEEVEEELTAAGVRLDEWQNFRVTDV